MASLMQKTSEIEQPKVKDEFSSWIEALDKTKTSQPDTNNNASGSGSNGLGSGESKDSSSERKSILPFVSAHDSRNKTNARGSPNLPSAKPGPQYEEWEIKLAQEPGFSAEYVNEMFNTAENKPYEDWLTNTPSTSRNALHMPQLPSTEEYEPIVALRDQGQEAAANHMQRYADNIYSNSVNQVELTYVHDPLQRASLRTVWNLARPQDTLMYLSDQQLACDRLMINDNLVHNALGQNTARSNPYEISQERLASLEAKLKGYNEEASEKSAKYKSLYYEKLNAVDPKIVNFIEAVRTDSSLNRS